MWKNLPDLLGTTGEKTGLAEYIKAQGIWPIAYLKVWRKHPNIENLVKAGWGATVAASLDEMVTQALDYGMTPGGYAITWADLSQAKPHRQMGMTKEEFRQAKQWKWGTQHANLWAVQNEYGIPCTATEFNHCIKAIGLKNVEWITHRAEKGKPVPLRKLLSYLEKQGDITMKEGAEYLRDLWDALDAEAEVTGRPLTDEQCWPRRLREAHDRATENKKNIEDMKARRFLLDGFRHIVDKYGELEWTDGDLCVRLPRDNGDLIREGNVLRHCVGGYGNNHVNETDVIFFIRRYRRPERSYYTLDINFKKERPTEVQLHGYGNERHGQHKEYRHKIPEKVRNFCDRWEQEVLQPWFAEQKRAEAKAKKKKQKNKKKKEVA